MMEAFHSSWREFDPFSNKYSNFSNVNRNEEQNDKDLKEELKRKGSETLTPNHVLLFTIVNPLYPITVHVLHTICSPIGLVQRIVIFKKNGVQAMVEFDSVETAKQAKQSLNGVDMFSGCCTLKIQFAKPLKLNVNKNDSESWDYTAPPSGKVKDTPNRRAPLLPDPGFSVDNTLKPHKTSYSNFVRGGLQRCWQEGSGYVDEVGNNDNAERGYLHYGDRFPTPTPIHMDGGMLNGNTSYIGLGDRGDTIHTGRPALWGSGYGLLTPTCPPNSTQNGCVMMVYGLDKDKVNPDRLFNIFCLYGNVIKVKFLKTKEGCAMIQMGDSISVERCISNLNNSTIGDMQIQLGFSKQAYLSDVGLPYSLPDNSKSFKDFTGSKNNRFINPRMASKNRIQGPSKVLHFFNTPPALTEETIQDLLEDKCNLRPNVQLFPMKGDRSSSGLLYFDNVENALLALMLCNHAPVENPSGKFPYVMKLCFSSNRFPVNLNCTDKSDTSDKSE